MTDEVLQLWAWKILLPCKVWAIKEVSDLLSSITSPLSQSRRSKIERDCIRTPCSLQEARGVLCRIPIGFINKGCRMGPVVYGLYMRLYWQSSAARRSHFKSSTSSLCDIKWLLRLWRGCLNYGLETHAFLCQTLGVFLHALGVQVVESGEILIRLKDVESVGKTRERC